MYTQKWAGLECGAPPHAPRRQAEQGAVQGAGQGAAGWHASSSALQDGRCGCRRTRSL